MFFQQPFLSGQALSCVTVSASVSMRHTQNAITRHGFADVVMVLVSEFCRSMCHGSVWLVTVCLCVVECVWVSNNMHNSSPCWVWKCFPQLLHTPPPEK